MFVCDTIKTRRSIGVFDAGMDGGQNCKHFGVRLLDYTSHKWRRIAEKVRRRDKQLCQKCLRYGRKTPAKIVHHIEPVEVNPDRAYDIDNLMSLCEACHNAAHPEKGGSPPGRRGI